MTTTTSDLRLTNPAPDRQRGNVLCLLLLLAALLAPLPVQAGQRRTPPVPRCRIVHGTRVCLPVYGGSGITPPVLSPRGAR